MGDPDMLVSLAEACLELGASPPDRIVAMIEYQGRMLVATERHVFQLQDSKFVPIIFASPLDGPAPVATSAAGDDSNGGNGREPGQVPS